MTVPPDERIAFIRANHERYLRELTAWIACPSISADPAHAADVRASAETAAALLRASGLSGEVLETQGHPVAFGEWLGAPGAPTVLIYGHHDVQPADPLDLWTTPPFEAQVRDGKIYGRGSVDDKGQVLMHLAAIEAHLRVNGRLPINVKVVVEGEEEIGSPNFEAFLARERKRLACDVVVVSDTAVFAEDVPSLTVSLRGIVDWEITVHGPSTDLHSGYFGGIVRNPLEALAQMLATLKDRDGRVAVPGFYDAVRELTAAERAEYARLPYDEAHEAQQLGVPELAGEAGYTELERIWRRPTLEINGMYGGYQGPGRKTIVPSFARAKLSARLVPAQDPARQARRERDCARRPPACASRSKPRRRARGRTSRDHPAVAARRARWSADSANRRSSSAPAARSGPSRRSTGFSVYRRC